MKKCYCLLNHDLTENQLKELKEIWKIEEIIYPREELIKEWSQVAAVTVLDYELISKICGWLCSAKEGDVFIVQGEFGSTFCLVDYALKNGLTAVHAVTKRIAGENRVGEVVNRRYVFEHCCFRKYEYFSEKCEFLKRHK